MASKEIQVGFIRDKTTMFRNFRSTMNFQTNPTNVDSGLINSDPMAPVQARGETHVISAANSIEAAFSQVKADMDLLKKLHKDRLRANFSDNKAQDAAIEAKTRAISTQFTELRDRIRNQSQSTHSDSRVLEENMKMGFVARLRDLTTEFRTMQANYIQNLRNLDAKTAKYKEEDSDDGDFALDDFDPGLTGDQTSQIMANEIALQQRNQEITNLIQMMNQLNELFSDLGTLIIEQGTMLDRIDATVVEAREHVVKGNEELRQAETHQKSKCFYIYIILVVVLIIIFGIVIIVKKNKAKNQSQN